MKRINKTIKAFLSLCTIIFTLSLSSPILADDLDFLDDLDDLSGLTDDDVKAWEDEHRDGPTTPTLTLPGIFKLISTPNIIKKPLWSNTRKPHGRDILHLLPHKITALEYGGIALNLFFNMTDNMHVKASSLFDLTSINQTAVAALIKIILENAPDKDLSGIIPLFHKMTIQERKAGALLQGGIIKGPFTLQLHTSFHMSERNFWLSKKDRAIIENTFGGDKLLEEDEFFRIKYGLGDTRFKLGLNTINTTSFQLDCGLEAILPTSRFSSKLKLDTSPTEITDEESFKKSGITLLQNLRDFLINPQMGNNGHFGLGCYVESKVGIFHDLAQLWFRISYDTLFPGDEYRLIMLKPSKSIDEYQRIADEINSNNTNLTDPGRTPDDLKNFNQYLKEYLFPSAFKATTHPEGIFNFVSSVNVDIRQCHFTVGYDFFLQQKEQIKKILNTSINPLELRIDDAERKMMLQHKIFSEMGYTKRYNHFDLRIALGGDVTAHAKGIGYDWTAYLKLASSF